MTFSKSIPPTVLAYVSYPACQRCYALPTVRQAERSRLLLRSKSQEG